MCAAGSHHEPPSDGQRGAGSQGGAVDGDQAACPDLDGCNERPHHQPHIPWHGPGHQGYAKKTQIVKDILAIPGQRDKG